MNKSNISHLNKNITSNNIDNSNNQTSRSMLGTANKQSSIPKTRDIDNKVRSYLSTNKKSK